MRRRFSNNDLHEVARPSGALTESELEEIRRAYADGCEGEILIGMRGEERVITMLLPAQATKSGTAVFLQFFTSKLKEVGCDTYIRIFKD